MGIRNGEGLQSCLCSRGLGLPQADGLQWLLLLHVQRGCLLGSWQVGPSITCCLQHHETCCDHHRCNLCLQNPSHHLGHHRKQRCHCRHPAVLSRQEQVCVSSGRASKTWFQFNALFVQISRTLNPFFNPFFYIQERLGILVCIVCSRSVSRK